MMFDYKNWLQIFQQKPGYNDAASLGVSIEMRTNAKWRVAGIHHLTPSENRSKHNLFIDVIDKAGQRVYGAKIFWSWEGMREDQAPQPLIIDKPENEIPDIAMWRGQKISIWLSDSDKVTNIHTDHPDELGPHGEIWNSWGHHSFLVVFQEVDGNKVPNFDWQSWIQVFIDAPGYNNTGARILDVVNPLYKVLGVHRLTPNEDNAKQCIYVAVLDADNNHKADTEVAFSSGVGEPSLLWTNNILQEITWMYFPGIDNVNIWHPSGEIVSGLPPGHSYLVVFREVANPKPRPNLGGIQVTVNQEFIASLKPDHQGNVTFFVDIKDGNNGH